MNLEDIDWNVSRAMLLTEDQFLQQGLREGQYKSFGESESKLLQEAYRLIKLEWETGNSNPLH